VHAPACETDRQLAVTGIQDVAGIADRVHAAIKGSLRVEYLSPGAGVSGEAHGVLGVVPLPVTGVDNDEDDVTGVVPTFEGNDVVRRVGVGDLACGVAQGWVVPAKIVDVGDHPLHGGAEIVSDAEPVETIVVAGTDPGISKSRRYGLRCP
jgi:hypothetical protein